MNKTSLFVFVVLFWVVLAVLASSFEITLLGSSDTRDINKEYNEESAIKAISGNYSTDKSGKITAVENFASIFEIMSFRVTDQVPVAITILLDSIAIFTIYLLFSLIRGSG